MQKKEKSTRNANEESFSSLLCDSVINFTKALKYIDDIIEKLETSSNASECEFLIKLFTIEQLRILRERIFPAYIAVDRLSESNRLNHLDVQLILDDLMNTNSGQSKLFAIGYN